MMAIQRGARGAEFRVASGVGLTDPPQRSVDFGRHAKVRLGDVRRHYAISPSSAHHMQSVSCAETVSSSCVEAVVFGLCREHPPRPCLGARLTGERTGTHPHARV